MFNYQLMNNNLNKLVIFLMSQFKIKMFSRQISLKYISKDLIVIHLNKNMLILINYQKMNTNHESNVKMAAGQLTANQVSKQIQTSRQNSELKTQKANRAIGIFILAVMFGILWIYGWGSQLQLISSSSLPSNFLSQTIYGNLFILSAIFTVIGFGLLLCYFKNSTSIAFFTTIFTVSFTILISPIFQKFWFNVFFTDFYGATPISTNGDRFYIYSLEGQKIQIDLYGLKIALINAIAQLVIILGLFGRLNLPQVIVNSFLFNFAWNFNHFLCTHLQQINPDTRIFDDYQISSVYLFAATFGLVQSLMIRKPSLDVSFSSNEFSGILSQLGTFFLFLSFCTTTTFYSLKFQSTGSQFARSYVWQEATLGTFFALSASVISTYIFSILLGQGRIGIRQSILGTIMGAILYGPVAGTCVNIGAAIAIGLTAGFLSCVFYKKIYAKLNQEGVRDSFGIILVFLISFLATFMFSPIVIKTYYNYSVNLTTLESSSTDAVGAPINVNAAGWVLIYVAISVGLGLVLGGLTGLILYFLDKLTHHKYDDDQMFDRKKCSIQVDIASNQLASKAELNS